MKKKILFGTLGIIGILFILGQIPKAEEQQIDQSSQTVSQLYGTERAVEILGYDGVAMEPFISRDGKFLFFNSLNDAKDTSIYFAERVDEDTFRLVGKVPGVNGTPPHLDAVPSMDQEGRFYFVSIRDYPDSFENFQSGQWGDGGVTGVKSVSGDIYIRKPGWLMMDAEISPNGKDLYYVAADFSKGGALPTQAIIALAHRTESGFERDKRSEEFFASVNSAAPTYAPSISDDGLELFFTQLQGKKTTIFITRRGSVDEPFGIPELVSITGDLPEGPSVTLDKKHLYYHKKVGRGYGIFVMTRTGE